MASKPNRRLTGGSVRFRPVSIVLNNDNTRNRTEPPVNRRLGFEAAPKLIRCKYNFLAKAADICM